MNDLEEFKDKHSGEKVVLVGNGPSLAETNLDLIEQKDICSIAMNRIDLIFPKTKWRPTYYLYASDNIFNELWGERWKSSVNNMINSGTTCFIKKDYKRHLVTKDKEADNVYWFEAIDFINEWKRKRFKQKIMEAFKLYAPSLKIKPISMSDRVFSKNPKEYLSKFGSSMLIAYQLAYYMNFSKVILVGCDLKWRTSTKQKDEDPNHFVKNYGANIAFGLEDSLLVKTAHELAKKHLNDKGIRTVNASIDTELEIFERKKLEEVL